MTRPAKSRPKSLNAAMVARAFEVVLPAHRRALTLMHNPHHVEMIVVRTFMERTTASFISAVERQKAEATNEMWTLSYQPAGELDMDVCFAAATLPALMQWHEDNGLAFGS